MVSYDSLDIYKKLSTHEGDAEWFVKNVYKELGKIKIKEIDDIYTLIPHSVCCWSQFLLDDDEDSMYSKIHPFTRQNTQCTSCSALSRCDEDYLDSYIINQLSDIKPIATIRTYPSMNAVYSHPWVHTVLTMCVLNVSVLMYAYICNDIGTSIYHDISKPIDVNIDHWLNELDKINGFIAFPSETLFDENGYPSDMSSICWTHAKNPKIRWVGSIPSGQQGTKLTWLFTTWMSNSHPDSWEQWYLSNKLGFATTNKIDRREWNHWMTIFSIWLSDLKERKSITHKDKNLWTSPLACVEWLVFGFNEQNK